ncbi:MAG: sigma-70 family RNA polymerase sigma factor [Micromonosporaceae bacterium]
MGSPGDLASQATAQEPTSGHDRDPVTQSALVAASGDPVAQAAFVRLTQAELWRLIAALTEPAVADDLTQETYLRAFRALPSFQARSAARTWLFGIARRVCADHVRAVVRRRRLDVLLRRRAPADRSPDPASSVTAADLLQRLPLERRTAMVLTQMIGMSYQEAAAIEGVPVGTIRSRVARARSQLIEIIEAG